jgi:DNA-binding response OmpR family regulator
VHEPAPLTLLVIEDMTVDLMQHKVSRQGQSIDLTRTEFLLLELLAHSSPQVASRISLIEGIWGSVNDVSSGALDVLVNSLRSKIDLQFSTKLLHTVRGSGYQLLGNRSE